MHDTAAAAATAAPPAATTASTAAASQPQHKTPAPWICPARPATASASVPARSDYGGRPPWMNASSSDDPGTGLRIDSTPDAACCPHGNGSDRALGVPQGVLVEGKAVEQTNDEKPSASSSESGSVHALRWMVKEESGWWRKLVLNFTPSWFSTTMANGMVALMLHALPFEHKAITVLYTIIFIINVILFIVLSILAFLRYTLFPKTWDAMIRHPVQSLFLGCAPMGLTTVINMFIFVCIDDAKWGPWAAQFAWGLWWVDVVMAVACSIGLPFMMTSVHAQSLPAMTAVWLLPAATPIVTSSNGAAVASVLSNPQHALWTLMVSYVLWGIGLPMALLTLVIYFHRLAMHKLPPREVIVTVFMPVGPLGQGGFSIMNLGKVAMTLLPVTGTLHPLAGDVLYIMGFLTAIILWGFGLVWMFFAVVSVSRSRFPFNMGWWGFTFPTGVYVLSTLQMGEELPSAFFKILGTVMAVIVMVIWLVVVLVTIKRNLIGDCSFASCLSSARSRSASREEAERV